MRPATPALVLALLPVVAWAQSQHHRHGDGHGSAKPVAMPATATAQAGPAAHAGHAAHRTAAEPGPKARAQLQQLARAIERYRDVDVARREGWRASIVGREDSPLMGEHWSRADPREPHPDDAFDTTRPTHLQYARVDGRHVLVGVSFVLRIGAGDSLPEGFHGDADPWHVHDAEKAFAAMTEERRVLRALGNWWLDANYRDKGDHRGRLAMVHAWVTVPSPDGPFAMHNVAIPYLRAGLPQDWAVAGDEDAAQGVNLASPDGCRAALDSRLWIAHASGAQSRRLRTRCGEAARAVRAAIDADGAARVNAAARMAWRGLEAEVQRSLDARQRARVAALTEHDPMH